MYKLEDFLKNFGKPVDFEIMRITSNDITTAELIEYTGYGKIIGIKETELLISGKAGYNGILGNFNDWIPMSIVTAFRSEM